MQAGREVGDASAARGDPSPAPLSGPPLVITVGFAGHRAIDGAPALAAELDHALATLKRAVTIAAVSPLPDGERLGETFHDRHRLRLLTGDAPGADRIAIGRWQAADLGEVHRLYPFRDPTSGEAVTDRPERSTPDMRLPTPAGEPWTGFDAGLGLTEDEPHSEVGRWIVRHADVLVVVWDGGAVDKGGGTGDTLRQALERGVPVVRLRPDETGALLIDPSAVHQRSWPQAAEVLAQIGEPLTDQSLARLVVEMLAPPSGGRRGARDPEVVARRDYAHSDPLRVRPWPLNRIHALLDQTLWRAFSLFEAIAGGRAARTQAEVSAPAPASLQAQPGFTLLTTAFQAASDRAERLSRVHRSQQLLLVIIATLAVLVGALPALLTSGRSLHVAAAAIEFLLGGAAFFIALAARRAHRHRRWSDARRLAERLRAARAAWPFGVDIGDARVARAQTWTEWWALAMLRAAGPRRGWITGEAIAESAAWIDADLIEGQIAYHARQHRSQTNIERSIRVIEGAAFGLLMATLGAYLLAAWWGGALGWSMPEWVGGVVTVVSAVSPAVGAACLALDATSGFGEQALRSERMEREFERMQAQLGESGGRTLRRLQDVARRTGQLLVEDADAWRDRVARRRIVRGG